MQRIQRQFKNDDDIRLLSHTVDPERDDAERLAEYADMYEADSSKWFFVTGDKKALYHQARKGYFLNATEGDGGPEDFIHSERIVLVDKDKVIRGYYDGTDPESVNKLMVDIKILQLSYSRGKSRKVLELDRERAAKTEMDKNTK
jgi:protein SCO1/2